LLLFADVRGHAAQSACKGLRAALSFAIPHYPTGKLPLTQQSMMGTL
jgi:hypothetical protein